MKIAIPTADGRLCLHFGHCETFAIVEADADACTVSSVAHLTPPPHEPGLAPMNMSMTRTNSVAPVSIDMSSVLNPAVLAVTD